MFNIPMFDTQIGLRQAYRRVSNMFLSWMKPKTAPDSYEDELVEIVVIQDYRWQNSPKKMVPPPPKVENMPVPECNSISEVPESVSPLEVIPSRSFTDEQLYRLIVRVACEELLEEMAAADPLVRAKLGLTKNGPVDMDSVIQTALGLIEDVLNNDDPLIRILKGLPLEEPLIFSESDSRSM